MRCPINSELVSVAFVKSSRRQFGTWPFVIMSICHQVNSTQAQFSLRSIEYQIKPSLLKFDVRSTRHEISPGSLLYECHINLSLGFTKPCRLVVYVSIAKGIRHQFNSLSSQFFVSSNQHLFNSFSAQFLDRSK